jgi:hypothetical protein
VLVVGMGFDFFENCLSITAAANVCESDLDLECVLILSSFRWAMGASGAFLPPTALFVRISYEQILGLSQSIWKQSSNF